MVKALTNYLRMVKFSHSIFALPFAGIAFIQALPDSGLLTPGGLYGSFYLLILKILICMVALRSAAMGFNRLVDRSFDAANPRTATREIPAGVISRRNAIIFIVIFTAIFIFTAFTINLLCGILTLPAIVLTFGYSFAKRFTMFSHYLLGLAIGLAPTATWIAVRGEVSLLALIWSAGLMFYIAGFDILYSCQDADFDQESGLHSLPARLGVDRSLLLARLSHIFALALFILAGYLSLSGAVYFFAVTIVGILFVVEHSMVRPNNLSNIPIAFFNINASISSILFLGLLMDYIIK